MNRTKQTESMYPFAKMPLLPSEMRNAFAAMAELQGEAVKAALKYQIETLTFVTQRLKKDIDLVEQLGASVGRGDTYDVCVDFCREAFSDYSNEASRLAKIESRVAADAATKIREESRAFVEDVATQTAA